MSSEQLPAIPAARWYWYFQPSTDRFFKVILLESAPSISPGIVLVRTMLAEIMLVPQASLGDTRTDALSNWLAMMNGSYNLRMFEGLGPDADEIMMRLGVQMRELLKDAAVGIDDSPTLSGEGQ